MARIQWTPLAVDDVSSSAIRAQQMAGQTFQNAFSSLNGVIGQWENSQRDREMGELLRRQESFVGKDSALYDAARARGELGQGFKYIKPEALASSIRSFGSELERDYRGDLAFADGRVDRTFTLDERARTLANRDTGVIVAREANAIQDDLTNNRITAEQASARMAALAARTNEASQINDVFSAGRAGIKGQRDNTTWDRDTWRYGNEMQNREWTVQDRQDAKEAEAIVTQFREFGPNITVEDVIGSDAYQKASAGARAQILANFGGGAGGGAGVLPGGGGNWTETSGMAASESGGRWNIVNGEGYGGRNQFGDARLADAANAGIIPKGMTGAQFSRLPPAKQMEVENWHWNDIDQQAEKRGLNRYIGQTVGGVVINQGSIRGMAQLGGIGGAARFIQSGGQYNPADSNGTKLSDYGSRFSRASVPSSATVQGRGTDLAIGAAIARSTDPNAAQARTIFDGLSDDSSMLEVARRAVSPGADGAPGGKFAGIDDTQMQRIIREVQDRYGRRHRGAQLPPAAAAAIAEAAATPFDFRKDIGRGLMGQARGVGNTGGFFGSSRYTLNWDQVDARLARLNNGGRGLAEDVRNNERTQAIIEQGTAGRAQLEALRSQLAQQELRDLEAKQPNNPATMRMRRQIAQLSQQWETGAAAGESYLEGYGQPPRVPLATSPSMSLVNPNRPQQSRYVP